MKHMPGLLLFLFCLMMAAPAARAQTGYSGIKAEAEAFYAKGSYAQAAAAYEKASKLDLDGEEALWVRFRKLDCAWRAARSGSSEGKEETVAEVRRELERMAEDLEAKESKPPVYGEILVSLGYLFLEGRNINQWNQARPHFEKALAFWASQDAEEKIRQRYVAIALLPLELEDFYYGYGLLWPLEVCENALQLAKTKEEKCGAAFLLAQALLQSGQIQTPAAHRRVREHFVLALQMGKAAEWYDDALMAAAQFAESQGRLEEQAPGQYRLLPDYEEAARLYRRLTTEFAKGKSRYYEQAEGQLKNITEPMVQIGVGGAFTPDSLIEYNLTARNATEIELAFYKLDLAKALGRDGVKQRDFYPSRDDFSRGKGAEVRRWKVRLEQEFPHQMLAKSERVPTLPAGAYWLEATGGGKTGGTPVLLTQTAVTAQPADGKMLLFSCDAMTGAPKPAKLTVLRYLVKSEGDYDQRRIVTEVFPGESNADGVCLLSLPKVPDQHYVQGTAVVAEAGGQPAFLRDGPQPYELSRNPSDRYRVYVFTDRPAYRPEETVNFQAIVRYEHEGTYRTPAEEKINVRVRDPRGNELLKKEITLNAFGSLADSFAMPKDATLGEYQIEFRRGDDSHYIGSQALFRLEEYKLPEYRVAVKMPEQNGKPQIFRVGERVRAEIQVEYYAGGAIANADVEYDLFQSNYEPENPWPVPYPWLYRNLQTSLPWMRFWNRGNSDQMIKRERTKTDAEGKAVVEFQIQAGLQNLQYKVVARVRDASNREVEGSGSVKVTVQPFQLYLKPESQVYLPGDSAAVEVRALDANNNPVATPATLVVTRERYIEKKKVNKKTQAEVVVFRGYEPEEIERRDVGTDTEGKLKLRFKPEKEGFYRVRLVSPPYAKAAGGKLPPDRVIGETTLFACTQQTKDLGYRFGALQLFPDKATYKKGETARVVVIAPEDNSTALLSLQAGGLLEYRVLRMGGTAQLAEFPVTEAFQPNVFLQGIMIRDSRVMVAQEELIVPPDEHFLNVEVTRPKELLRPGEKSQVSVKVTDAVGKPVKAQVALGVADASVFYIQQELAGDIREFFFGEKRGFQGHARSMLNEMQVRTLGEKDEDEEVLIEGESFRNFKDRDFFGGRRRELLMDENELLKSDSGVSAVTGGWAFGGMKKSPLGFADAVMEVPAPAAAPMIAADGAMREMNGYRRGSDSKENKSGADKNETSPNVVVRSDFRSTAFWQPSIQTDTEGLAKVEIAYPESLTEWKASARAVTAGSQFGMGGTLTRTNLPLSARLQTPRFLVEGDSAEISAILNNQGAKPLSVSAHLSANGKDGTVKPASSVVVEPGKQQRVAMDYQAAAPGSAAFAVEAKGSGEGDAMKLDIPIVEHGIEKFIARSEVIEAKDGGNASSEMVLDLPEHREGSASLEVWITPSLASTCLDALPYLAKYPYGCVEQTMSRFLPAVVTARTLKDMNLEPAAVAGRLFGGIEKGVPDKLHMEKGDLAKLDEMTTKGLKRLRDMQHGDGGWGWWKEDGTDDFMTAYVVQGLALADRAGVSGAMGEAGQGANYLIRRLVQYENEPDMAAWLLHAIALASQTGWEANCTKAAARLYGQKDRLNPYTRSLLALALQERRSANKDYTEWAKVLVENLENGAKDVSQESALIGKAASATSPDMCHWGEAGVNHRWSEGGIEATAYALRALLAVDPGNKRADMAARWLIANRRGAQWKNTKDTALVILSLLDYMKARQEASPQFQAEVLVNGRKLESVKFTRENALGLLKLQVPASSLQRGANKVAVKLQGSGRLYASSYLKYFSKEVPIPAAGNEIYVKREYYRERPVPRLVNGVNVHRTLLKDGDELKPGDTVEVRLLVEAKNHFEYVVFEDKRPAGCEAVQIRSGEPLYATKQLKDGTFRGGQTFVYQELRDQHAAFFLTRLEEGVHEIKYRLRAETPGRFHALPTLGHAMYVPEIRCNGDEVRLVIKEGD
jgi:uncharacterized protein YfaS (alpha-2-macroglobulin family)